MQGNWGGCPEEIQRKKRYPLRWFFRAIRPKLRSPPVFERKFRTSVHFSRKREQLKIRDEIRLKGLVETKKTVCDTSLRMSRDFQEKSKCRRLFRRFRGLLTRFDSDISATVGPARKRWRDDFWGSKIPTGNRFRLANISFTSGDICINVFGRKSISCKNSAVRSNSCSNCQS